MDWSIEISKDFVSIYYFKLKNAVAMLLAAYFPVQVCFYLFRLVITVSLTLTIKVSFSQVNNEEKNQKRKQK